MSNTSASSNAVWETFDSSKFGRGNAFFHDKFSCRPGRDLPVPAPMDMPMQLCVASSQHYAPTVQRPRTILIKQHKFPSNNRRNQVSFNCSVDVRVSLAGALPHEKTWYTKDEVRSMRVNAMKPNSPLRHSERMDASTSFRLQQHLLSSPPPTEDGVTALDPRSPFLHHEGSSPMIMTRVHSANAELHSAPADGRRRPDPQDVRYQKLVPEMDREVFVTNEERRNSARRRILHYRIVEKEIDRQVHEGYMMLNVSELAQASRMATGNAMAHALEKGRKDATLAQAITLGSKRRL